MRVLERRVESTRWWNLALAAFVLSNGCFGYLPAWTMFVAVVVMAAINVPWWGEMVREEGKLVFTALMGVSLALAAVIVALIEWIC